MNNFFNNTSDIINYLDKTDPKTKVKVKILDFATFKQFLPLIEKYNKKFYLFKYETNFVETFSQKESEQKKEITNFKECFTNWIEQQNLDEEVKDILLKEAK